MSRPPRFFITPDQVRGPRIVISGDDLRHIHAVLRKQPGDMLILLDGQGMEYAVKITALGRSEIMTEIVDQNRREIRHPLIALGQGLPKSDKMDWIVQKATELGVSSIVPLVMERTIVKVKDGQTRIERWRKIAREAAMQSSRPDIPRVEHIRKYSEFVKGLASSDDTLLVLPWEEGREPIKTVLRRNLHAKNIVVLIGPEGGISSTEAEMAVEKGFHPVSLGPNVLRTETAAVAALSMILYETSSNQITNPEQ